jgi:hypothetical protein
MDLSLVTSALLPKGTTSRHGCVAVPGEDVLLLALPFPAMPQAQMRAAVRFAAEPFLLQPLEGTVVVLGPELAASAGGGPSGSGALRLVAAIDQAKLAALIKSAGRGRPLVPDVLFLPRPLMGAWSVAPEPARMRIRLPDGTGFACTPEHALILWKRAGCPRVESYGAMPPAGLTGAVAMGPVPEVPPLGWLDLSGAMADPRRGLRWGAGLAAAVLVMAAAHGATLQWTVNRLAAEADRQEAALRVGLEARGVAPGASVEIAASEVLAGSVTGQNRGPLAVLSQASAALSAQSGLLRIDDLEYDSTVQRLILRFVAPDISELDLVTESLRAAGLSPEAGPATLDKGVARMTVSLSAGEKG